MGLFLDDAEVERAVRSTAPRSHAENRAAAKAGPKASRRALFDPAQRGCEHCALKSIWPQLTSPRMKASGNTRDPDILVMGEGPGEQEDRQGKVFVGSTGQLLRSHLSSRHSDRLLFTNAVRCRPPENRTPTGPEMHACSVHLEADLAKYDIKAILGVGGAPMGRFLPETTILRAHGIRFPVKIADKTYWYYPVMHPSFVSRMKDQSEGRGDGPAMPVFKADLKRFFQEVDKWGTPRVHDISAKDVTIARTQEDAEALLNAMHGPKAVDIETSKLRPFERDAKILTAAFSDGEKTVAFPVQHPEAPNNWGLELLLSIVQREHWIAHSASMELSWFRYFINPDDPMAKVGLFDDTMALARLYYEREWIRSLELVSHIHLGVNVKAIGGVNPRKIMDYPLAEILPYNGLDAKATALIYHGLIRRVDKKGYERILAATDATTTMELAGLEIDYDNNAALQKEWQAKAQAAQQAAKRIYEVKAYERSTSKEFNIASNAQVGEALVTYGKVKLTANKQNGYVVDDDALSKLVDKNPLAKLVLDYREADKINSTYLEPVRQAQELYYDKRLHPGYETTKTATLRRSSNSPNIQNFPKRRHREIRRQIVAPKGHLMVPFDYGQLEARILAMVSRDKNLCRAIIDGYDIHSAWLDNVLKEHPDYLDRLAHKTNQTEPAKIRKMGRDIIKTDFVFSSFYGSSSKSIAKSTDIPLEHVLALHRRFWHEFQGVGNWIKNRRLEYQQTGSILNINGRVRHSILWGNEMINTPIQSVAADIVADVMGEIAAIARRERDLYLHPRIDLHDDLTFILPVDALEDYIRYIAKIMVRVRYDWQIVPLTVECKIGENWCDLEEVFTFAGDYVH